MTKTTGAGAAATTLAAQPQLDTARSASASSPAPGDARAEFWRNVKLAASRVGADAGLCNHVGALNAGLAAAIDAQLAAKRPEGL